jgi:hypothetical protein
VPVVLRPSIASERFVAGDVVPDDVIPATAGQPVIVHEALLAFVNSRSVAHVPAATPPGPSSIFSSLVRQGAAVVGDRDVAVDAEEAGVPDAWFSVLAHPVAARIAGSTAAAATTARR